MATNPKKTTATNSKTHQRTAKALPRGMRKDPRRGHDRVTATSGKLTFTVDDRPSIWELNLPGPRRALEGRGGATTDIDVLRYVIRCPLLPALARAIRPRNCGRPSAYPDLFWVFVLVANRHYGKNEEFLQELKAHWVEIAKEFYFEHGIALPRQKGVAYNSFNSWRTNAIIDRTEQLDILLARFTDVSIPLALTIRRAEGGDEPRDLLEPAVWDCIAADGTTRNAPSNVEAELVPTADGGFTVKYPGSRAKTGLPRVHESMPLVDKQHGSPQGVFNVVATTKGVDTYTRTALGVEIGQVGEGETPVAMRLLHRVYGRLGNTLPTLLYDGAMTPVNWQELMAQYGVFCVNANYTRKLGSTGKKVRGESVATDFEPNSTTTGEGSHHYGRKRGTKKATYVTDLGDIRCSNGGGEWHVHHLAADGGGVFETDQRVLAGRPAQRIQFIEPSRLERNTDRQGRHGFELHFEGQCHRAGGHYTFTQDLQWTAPDSDGHLSWRSLIANVRIIPEMSQHYPKINGGRNQIEAFFDWLEDCFTRHDRASSWGHDAQVLDLIAAGLLHNAEAWAHLAYRHPEHAEELLAELDELETPDLSGVQLKPEEARKASINAQLLEPAQPRSVNALVGTDEDEASE